MLSQRCGRGGLRVEQKKAERRIWRKIKER